MACYLTDNIVRLTRLQFLHHILSLLVYTTFSGRSRDSNLSISSMKNPQKQTAPLRGLERKLHGKKETDSQTSLGGFPPGMASRAHPGRQISQYFATFLEQL